MNILEKIIYVCTIMFVLGCNTVNQPPKEVKLPLELQENKLKSIWTIGDSTKAKVMLETGYPIMIINREFFEENEKVFNELAKEETEASVVTWGEQGILNAEYRIGGIIEINGKHLTIEALVVDINSYKPFNGYDIIFPLKDFKSPVEINIKEKYIILNKNIDKISPDFNNSFFKYDEKTKGLYVESTLEIFDTTDIKEELVGNYLFDTGASNSIYLNKNRKEVVSFIHDSDRMLIKDTTRFTPNKRTKLEILHADRLKVAGIECNDIYIVCMELYESESSDNYVGVIGNSVFKNYTIVFDFTNNQVFMKKALASEVEKQNPNR